MTNTTSRRGKITDENREESRRLKSIWDQTYPDRKLRGLHTQAAFGIEFDIGGQAAVGFFLNAQTALSLKVSIFFYKVLWPPGVSPKVWGVKLPTSALGWRRSNQVGRLNW